ncbi:hypothetical protein ACFUEN_35900 [Streptomyces griseorubiginosus]|uniref:hypothetical protein n=1 Tax=Streptomyces griseorubiginosus TaxID=67304 RepID=UPI003633C018
MTPRTQLILATIALCVFTGLAVTMLCLGQPANAIGSLILAIVLGVTQLVQALTGLPGSRRSVSSPAKDSSAGIRSAEADGADSTSHAMAGTAAAVDDERPAP